MVLNFHFMELADRDDDIDDGSDRDDNDGGGDAQCSPNRTAFSQICYDELGPQDSIQPGKLQHMPGSHAP